MMSLLEIFILTIQLVRVASAVKACYYPDGNQQTADTPCDASAADSHCCGSKDICLSNGLCFQVGGVQSVTRGSCTDATWSSPACSRLCIDGTSFNSRNPESRRAAKELILACWPENGGGGCVITQAPTVSSNAGWSDLFCCMDFNITTKRCHYKNNGSDQPFPIPSAELIFDRSSGGRNPNCTLSSARTFTMTSTVISETRSTGSPNPIPCTTRTAIADHETHCDQSEKLAIGAGIGIPMLAAACAALVAFYFQKRQTTKFKLKLEKESKIHRQFQMIASMSTVKADTSGQQELDEIHVNEVDGRACQYEMG